MSQLELPQGFSEGCPRYFQLSFTDCVKRLFKKNFSADLLRTLLQSDGVFVKERYLGLHSPGDAGFPSDYAAKLATLVEQFVDLEAVLELAAAAQVPDCPQRIPLQIKDARRVQVAVAKDAAFSFYYQE